MKKYLLFMPLVLLVPSNGFAKGEVGNGAVPEQTRIQSLQDRIVASIMPSPGGDAKRRFSEFNSGRGGAQREAFLQDKIAEAILNKPSNHDHLSDDSNRNNVHYENIQYGISKSILQN